MYKNKFFLNVITVIALLISLAFSLNNKVEASTQNLTKAKVSHNKKVISKKELKDRKTIDDFKFKAAKDLKNLKNTISYLKDNSNSLIDYHDVLISEKEKSIFKNLENVNKKLINNKKLLMKLEKELKNIDTSLEKLKNIKDISKIKTKISNIKSNISYVKNSLKKDEIDLENIQEDIYFIRNKRYFNFTMKNYEKVNLMFDKYLELTISYNIDSKANSLTYELYKKGISYEDISKIEDDINEQLFYGFIEHIEPINIKLKSLDDAIYIDENEENLFKKIDDLLIEIDIATKKLDEFYVELKKKYSSDVNSN